MFYLYVSPKHFHINYKIPYLTMQCVTATVNKAITNRFGLVWDALDSAVSVVAFCTAQQVLGLLDDLFVPALVLGGILGFTGSGNVRLKTKYCYVCCCY